MTQETPTSVQRINIIKWGIVGLIGAFVIFLLFLSLTGEIWRAAAYGVVALFAFLVVLAVYFWGALFFGGTLEALGRRRTSSVPWKFDAVGLEVEHDIDPGLELVSAGILVYRFGEVRPRIHFRNVPLINVRAIRPFVVARTGSPRDYQFDFNLTDDQDRVRFEQQFDFYLKSAPQIVMPHCRLSLTAPKNLIGQRWNLQVRAGVTVVTSFRFAFVENPGSTEEQLLTSQMELLPHLLDEAIKQDAMTSTQEVMLEDL